MAKQLNVQYRGRELHLGLDKVDRARLYGYVDAEVLDETGQPCELATLGGDGNTLIGRGGTALATLSPNGIWREKSALQAVDPEGNLIMPVRSSFDAPMLLEKHASIDDYLAHNIHLVYRLDIDGDATELLDELRGGAIYTFPFSYRGGLEAYAGFLLIGSDGNLFLAAGSTPSFEFVGLNQPAGAAEEEAAEEDEEDTGFDFGMM
jgi:hypothetical protein